MGEDALRVLEAYLTGLAAIRRDQPDLSGSDSVVDPGLVVRRRCYC